MNEKFIVYGNLEGEKYGALLVEQDSKYFKEDAFYTLLKNERGTIFNDLQSAKKLIDDISKLEPSYKFEIINFII